MVIILSPNPHKPYDRTVLSLKSQGTKRPFKAKQFCTFFPNLHIPQYRESLSEIEKALLDRRCEEMIKKAIAKQRIRPSEHFWEQFAWKYVFSSMLDDYRLQMDKRRYEFIESTDVDTAMVYQRTVDATIGLNTYGDDQLRRSSECSNPRCEEDHSLVHTLSKENLYAMMHNNQCSLVVDGLWGEIDIVFPFAVYEAKKSRSLKAAQNQVLHACRAYLTMLDNLARNPDNIAEYQTEESSKCQMFAFVSSGSFWQVFVAWRQLGDSIIEIIWEGDVKKPNCALDLLCIVDQIHNYARNHHRYLVMKHLEAWHARHRRFMALSRLFQRPCPRCDPSESTRKDDIFTLSDEIFPLRGEVFTLRDVFQVYLETHLPERVSWSQIKAQSIMRKSRQRAETRRRNRSLRSASAVQNAGKKTEKKRGRGRPLEANISKTRL